MHRSRLGRFRSLASRFLARDGELIDDAEIDGLPLLVDVLPEPAHYRLEFDFHQTMFEFTQRERLVWTFESAHVPEGETQSLPLLSERFHPELDERGRAPLGKFASRSRWTASARASPKSERGDRRRILR